VPLAFFPQWRFRSVNGAFILRQMFLGINLCSQSWTDARCECTWPSPSAGRSTFVRKPGQSKGPSKKGRLTSEGASQNPEVVQLEHESVDPARVVRAANLVLRVSACTRSPVITDSFMHSRSRHVLPRLRESIGTRAATIATKPAVRSCVVLVLG
jgi:hypothetical protein